jgi:hypothetical protein
MKSVSLIHSDSVVCFITGKVDVTVELHVRSAHIYSDTSTNGYEYV